MVKCENVKSPQLASGFPSLVPFHGDQLYFGSLLVLNCPHTWSPNPSLSSQCLVIVIFMTDLLLFVSLIALPPPGGRADRTPHKIQPSTISRSGRGREGEGALVLQQGRVRPKIASNCHLLSLAGCALLRHFPSTVHICVMYIV